MTVSRVLTQRRHGFLALLHLLGHHAANAHQTLCDVTGRLGQTLFGHFANVMRENTDQLITNVRKIKVNLCLIT